MANKKGSKLNTRRLYPTKHGFEYFITKPTKLNLEWVAVNNKTEVGK